MEELGRRGVAARKGVTGMGQRGNFFAVDRRTWAHLCERLDTNTAAAYLVMANGTGGDNATTSWSVNSVQEYLGLSLGRARTSVQALLTNGYVECVQSGTRPRYKLTAWNAMRPRLTVMESLVIEKVRRGDRFTRGRQQQYDRKIARQLAHAGWLLEVGDRFTVADTSDVPQWLWLPSTVIEGAGDEIPPVHRLRQSQDVLTLRLFVDCYGGQHLAEYDGIDPRVMWQSFERVRVGQQAQYVVWGFRCQGITVSWTGLTRCHQREKLTAEEQARGSNTGIDLFARLERLASLGLMEWIPYLVESGEPRGAQPIHPCGERRPAKTIEDQIGMAAHAAASRMLTDGQRAWAEEQRLTLVPVPAHFVNVALVGIARLTYRAQTSVTAAWHANLQETSTVYLQRYHELTGSMAAAIA
jgi:hypothetical protein